MYIKCHFFLSLTYVCVCAFICVCMCIYVFVFISGRTWISRRKLTGLWVAEIALGVHLYASLLWCVSCAAQHLWIAFPFPLLMVPLDAYVIFRLDRHRRLPTAEQYARVPL